jgi:hypothetical protein
VLVVVSVSSELESSPLLVTSDVASDTPEEVPVDTEEVEAEKDVEVAAVEVFELAVLLLVLVPVLVSVLEVELVVAADVVDPAEVWELGALVDVDDVSPKPEPTGGSPPSLA